MTQTNTVVAVGDAVDLRIAFDIVRRISFTSQAGKEPTGYALMKVVILGLLCQRCHVRQEAVAGLQRIEKHCRRQPGPIHSKQYDSVKPDYARLSAFRRLLLRLRFSVVQLST